MADQPAVPAVPPSPAGGYRLEDVTEQLHQAERALWGLQGNLRPLLDALRGRQRTRELESAAATALDAGELLESAQHYLTTARVAFAAEAAMEARARMVVAISDGKEAG